MHIGLPTAFESYLFICIYLGLSILITFRHRILMNPSIKEHYFYNSDHRDITVRTRSHLTEDRLGQHVNSQAQQLHDDGTEADLTCRNCNHVACRHRTDVEGSRELRSINIHTHTHSNRSNPWATLPHPTAGNCVVVPNG